MVPHVFARFVGLIGYETDANLHDSTTVCAGGVGGIDGTLFAAFHRFDYDFICTIVLSIQTVEVILEYIADMLRAHAAVCLGLLSQRGARGIPRFDPHRDDGRDTRSSDGDPGRIPFRAQSHA